MSQRALFSSQNSESQLLSLRFIAGKYEGGEFLLEANREILIGRATDADLVLVEELVSRHHATLSRQGGVVRVCDLGSTNGTFVNGERVKRRELTPGDRLLIGTNILKLEVLDASSQEPASARRSLVSVVVERATVRGPRMRGELEEIPVIDLVQMLANAKKTGVLVLRGLTATGKIHFQCGQIIHAELPRLPGSSLRKALFRLLGMTSGEFELQGPAERNPADAVPQSSEYLVLEALRHQDEQARLHQDLPKSASRFSLPTPLAAQLEELDATELDLVQAALNAENWRELLDSRSESDLEVMQCIAGLLTRGYLHEQKS